MEEEQKQRHWYMLVRWVPNPARGEFVNIGALTFDNFREDGVLQKMSGFARADRLGKTHPELRGMVKRMVVRLTEAAPDGRHEVAQKMVHDHRNVVQFTPPLPMAVASLEEGMGFIFERMVGDE